MYSHLNTRQRDIITRISSNIHSYQIERLTMRISRNMHTQSSEEERVLDLSLLLVGGDGGEFHLLLVGVVTLGLGGVVLLLGGVGGMSLGTGLGVDGWLTKHLANSAEIILVRGRVVIVIFVL